MVEKASRRLKSKSTANRFFQQSFVLKHPRVSDTGRVLSNVKLSQRFKIDNFN